MVHRKPRAKPSDAPPGSQLLIPRMFTQRHTVTSIPYSQGSYASLAAQPTPLREFLGRSNQCGSETSKASDGHPRCSLNFVILLCPSLPLPVFGRLLFFPRPRVHKTPVSSAAVLQSPVMSNTRRFSATHSVYYFSFYPGPRSLALTTLPSWVNCGRPCGAVPLTPTSSCAQLLRYSHIQFAGGRLCRRECGCSATCTRRLGFEATSCDGP